MHVKQPETKKLCSVRYTTGCNDFLNKFSLEYGASRLGKRGKSELKGHINKNNLFAIFKPFEHVWF